MAQTRDNLQKAEDIASQEGGPKTAEASQLRDQTHSSDKMENELEMQKSNKTGADSADQVAGRKEKGAVTGLLEKITGDPKKGDPNK